MFKNKYLKKALNELQNRFSGIKIERAINILFYYDKD